MYNFNMMHLQTSFKIVQHLNIIPACRSLCFFALSNSTVVCFQITAVTLVSAVYHDW